MKGGFLFLLYSIREQKDRQTDKEQGKDTICFFKILLIMSSGQRGSVTQYTIPNRSTNDQR